MRTRNPKLNPRNQALKVFSTREYPYVHFWAQVVALQQGPNVPPAEQGLYAGIDTYVSTALTHLRIWSQGHEDKVDPRRLYGWEPEYRDIHSLSRADELSAMAAMIRKIEKGLDKISDAEGRPQTFGQYLARVGRALGISKMVFPTGRSWKDQVVLSLEGGALALDGRVQAWIDGSTDVSLILRPDDPAVQTEFQARIDQHLDRLAHTMA